MNKIKTIAVYLFLFAVLLSSVIPIGAVRITTVIPFLLGDVDGDGNVTILDATCIQRHLASIPVFAYNEPAADTDDDGTVTVLDATLIQRHLAQNAAPDNIGLPMNK